MAILCHVPGDGMELWLIHWWLCVIVSSFFFFFWLYFSLCMFICHVDFCTGYIHFFIHAGFPTSLESEPKLSELMNEVAAKIPNKWRDVGLQLGVTHSELEAFASASSPDTNSRFTSVFSAWQKHMNVPYTWTSLIQALKAPSVEEIRLAEKLKNRLTGSILPTQYSNIS